MTDEQFEEIFNQYKDSLIGYAKKITTDYFLADDAVQIAFTELYKNKKDVPNIEAWLKLVCKRHILKEYNKQRKRNGYCDEIDYESDVNYENEDDDNESNLSFDIEVLRECLSELRDNQREIFELHYFRKMKCKEIATEKNKSLSNIKTTLHRARKRVKQIYLQKTSERIK